eukprot:CAMPEP_0194346750 /NCGR_PEP_ID=MMETSP0171-20130528/105600_1 /TAXON_ID=218684 /ORGANISM="Corethron pennatum, Strain L29A3" /LENGTH=499 /DNA_ID=CAMNT_0039113911 /DNA_START=127 /DNA_END=1628 /DNA_ORIENTATION=+
MMRTKKMFLIFGGLFLVVVMTMVAETQFMTKLSTYPQAQQLLDEVYAAVAGGVVAEEKTADTYKGAAEKEEDDDGGVTAHHKQLSQFYAEDFRRVNQNANTTTATASSSINAGISSASFSSSLGFPRHDGVVIATKVHSNKSMNDLKQMLCLLTAAYNRHHHYDIVVFTTLPFTPEEITSLQDFVSPAALRVYKDSPPLDDQLRTFDAAGLLHLLEARCGLALNGTLTWETKCHEPEYPRSSTVALSYAWQAEFRTYHLWRHPGLAQYKYMMWLDTDAYCTKNWTTDPIDKMVREDLVIMFAISPKEGAGVDELSSKMQAAYGKTVCSAHIGDHGRLVATPCPEQASETKMDLTTGSTTFCSAHIGDHGRLVATPCPEQASEAKMDLIHGFHHITNLDFYRLPPNQQFLKSFVEKRFSRTWDDQLAVTAPPLMLAPERMYGYRADNVTLGIHHNGMLDGVDDQRRDFGLFFCYNKWFDQEKETWEAGNAMCSGHVKSCG